MFADDNKGQMCPDESYPGESPEDSCDFGASLTDEEFMSLFRRLDGDEVFSAGLKFVGLLRGF